MSQHDFDIANASGAAVRADLNNALVAGAGLSSGAAAPSTTYAYQWWFDTTNNILKIRNGANTAWVNAAQLIGSTWIPYRSGTLLGTAAVETIGTSGAVVPKLDGANTWSANQTINATLDADQVESNGSRIHPLVDGLETEIATTSGTAHDFTGIRADARKLTLTFEGVSLSGTDQILVQLGDAGGFETSGYIATATVVGHSNNTNGASSTTGFPIFTNTATQILSGQMVLVLSDPTNNTWIARHDGKVTTTLTVFGGGDKSLSGTLTQVRVTRTGTDTFDAGAVNLLVE